MRLNEFAPSTLPGSFHKSLMLNKLWLIKQLSNIKDQFGTIYLLGSWYGNLSLFMARSSIEFKRIINVDQDDQALTQGQLIAKKLGLADGIQIMCADVNDLDYQLLDKDGLIINTSCHDISNHMWFDHIPPGTMLALQTRNDVDHSLSQYALQKTLYQGNIELQDPETAYTSYLKIGIK